jgi:hypothetical protein
MKKMLIITVLAVAVSACSQSEPGTNVFYLSGGNVTVNNDSSSPLPVYIVSTPDSAESNSTIFWQGVGIGFAWGGIAWIFRLVRQTAKQNPEI